MPDNSTDVKVGKLIALIVDKGEDWKNVEVPKTEGAAPASGKAAEPKKAEAKESPKSDQPPPSEQTQ